MIDQARQAPTWLDGHYKEYHLFMTITPQERNLQINVQNKITAEQFTLIIDHKYIAGEAQFNNICEEPIDILGIFIQNFSNTVVEDGHIKVKYEIGTIRRMEKKFAFKLKKVDIDPLELANLKIERMKESFASQSAQKDRIILQLQTKFKEQQNKFKEALQVYAHKNKELADQIEELHAENKRLIASLRQSNQKEKAKINHFGKIEMPLPLFSLPLPNPKPSTRFWKKISQVNPSDENFNLTVKILSAQNFGRRVFMIIGDQTGIVQAFLKMNPLLRVGNTVVLKHAEAVVYKEHVQVQLMGNGKVEQVECNLRVNMGNDISAKQWIQSPY